MTNIAKTSFPVVTIAWAALTACFRNASRIELRAMRLVLSVSTLLGISVTPAGAAITLYSDETQFAAATFNITNIGFEGLAPSGSFISFGNPGSLTLSGVTFTTNSALFVQDNNSYGTGAFFSAQQTTPEIIDITLPSGITAIEGIYYFSDLTSASIVLNTGATVNLSGSTFPNAMYFGFSSDSDISSLQITQSGNGFDLDNFRFGHVIPEPSNMLLLTLGIFALGAGRHVFPMKRT